MPPSGLSQKAINGLLEFVKASYETIAEQYKDASGRDSSLTEREYLQQTANALEEQVRTLVKERFPNSERLNGGIEGLGTFVAECYKDLGQEILAGEDKYHRPVIDGKAIQKELSQIGKYLQEFKI